MKLVKSFGKKVEFIGNDKKTYTLYPLSLVEWGQFVTWVQYKPYRDALDADLPKEKCDEIFEQCRRGVTTETTVDGEEEFPINIGSRVVRDAMASLEGMGKFLQISISIGHPELRRGSIGHIINIEKAREVQDAVLRLNGLIADEEDEDEEKNL